MGNNGKQYTYLLMGQVVSVLEAGAVGEQEWYFLRYISDCVWKKHASAPK